MAYVKYNLWNQSANVIYTIHTIGSVVNFPTIVRHLSISQFQRSCVLRLRCTRVMAKAQDVMPAETELDWIQIRKQYESGQMGETTKEKMARKIKENPLVPIGCLATLGALTYGLWSFRTGNRRMSQIMMRTRIVAQGFTVVALIVGVGMTYGKKEA